MPHNYKNEQTNPDILPLNLSAIFGANASGKSNVLSAIECLKKIVTDSNYVVKSPIHHWISDSIYTTFGTLVKVGNHYYDYSLTVFAFGENSDKLQSREYYLIPV